MPVVPDSPTVETIGSPDLCVAGVEIFDPSRTVAYMRRIGNSCQPTPPDACGLAEDRIRQWTTPALDDAPWYDPDVPESADVLGVWVEEQILSVPWSRDVRARLRGASLGPGRLGGRELSLTGWLYARTPAAAFYGRQWLFEALAGDTCASGCDLPDVTLRVHCDPDLDGGFRTMKRVGLTSFTPSIEPGFPPACGFKWQATLTSEIPELFLDPDEVFTATLADAEEVCNLCSPCPDLSRECECGPLRGYPRAVREPDPVGVFCTPITVKRTCSTLGPPNYWRDAAAIVRVQAGRWPDDPDKPGVSNMRLRGWANPAGLDDGGLFDCQDPCMDVEVGCVPAGGELVIDATTRRATVLCGGEERNGYAYLSSAGGRRFQWPDVSCHGLMLCVDADSVHTAPDAQVTVDFVLRERG